MIEYYSYERVNDLYFNDSSEKAIAVFGEPEEKFENNQGYTILTYPNFTISFDQDDKFCYFALHPQTKAKINGIPITWTFDGIKPIIKLDSNTTENVGFITLWDLGIAFVDFNISEDDGINAKTIVFFRKGELEAYPDDKPFVLE